MGFRTGISIRPYGIMRTGNSVKVMNGNRGLKWLKQYNRGALSIKAMRMDDGALKVKVTNSISPRHNS
jgi:hypothetical protein